jgi:hypothetical protein
MGGKSADEKNIIMVIQVHDGWNTMRRCFYVDSKKTSMV